MQIPVLKSVTFILVGIQKFGGTRSGIPVYNSRWRYDWSVEKLNQLKKRERQLQFNCDIYLPTTFHLR